MGDACDTRRSRTSQPHHKNGERGRVRVKGSSGIQCAVQAQKCGRRGGRRQVVEEKQPQDQGRVEVWCCLNGGKHPEQQGMRRQVRQNLSADLGSGHGLAVVAGRLTLMMVIAGRRFRVIAVVTSFTGLIVVVTLRESLAWLHAFGGCVGRVPAGAQDAAQQHHDGGDTSHCLARHKSHGIMLRG